LGPRYLILPVVSSMPLTYGGASLAPRAGVALGAGRPDSPVGMADAGGIRVFLPRREPPPPMIDGALLPPPQTPNRMPARRAVVRALTARRRGHERRATPFDGGPHGCVGPTRPDPRCCAGARGANATAVPASGQSAAPKTSDIATAGPPAIGDPVAAPDQAVATAAPAETALRRPPLPRRPGAAATLAAGARPRCRWCCPKSARLVYASYGTVRVGGFMPECAGAHDTLAVPERTLQSDLSIDVVNFVESSRACSIRFWPGARAIFRDPPSPSGIDHPNSTGPTAASPSPRTIDRERPNPERGSTERAVPAVGTAAGLPGAFSSAQRGTVTLAGTRDVSHWTFTVTGGNRRFRARSPAGAARASNRTTASAMNPESGSRN